MPAVVGQAPLAHSDFVQEGQVVHGMLRHWGCPRALETLFALLRAHGLSYQALS
jgi:hypothetical protein